MSVLKQRTGERGPMLMKAPPSFWTPDEIPSHIVTASERCEKRRQMLYFQNETEVIAIQICTSLCEAAGRDIVVPASGLFCLQALMKTFLMSTLPVRQSPKKEGE